MNAVTIKKNERLNYSIMKKIQKFKFDLDCKVAIYVPSTINVNETTNNERQVNDVLVKLSTLFGGATATDVLGGWVCSNGELVTEKVKIVYSFCKSENLNNHIEDIIELANKVKKEMCQEAVTVEINGQVAFI